MKQPIPTSLILGFLGAGKTTAILDLLSHKPENEVWAVLVNEFGEVGIDGSLLEQSGAFVREVPGGCMCCVAGLPMQIGLNQLIHKAHPDRLLIEPTGLGHPSQILEVLTGEHYRDTLRLGPVLCLVDPRRLEDQRVLDNVQFQDQVAAADILVANKTDLCSGEQLARFDQWAATLEPAKQMVLHTSHGRLQRPWLDGETDHRDVGHAQAHQHHAARAQVTAPSLDSQPWQRVCNQGQGHLSIGWRVHPETLFDEATLLALSMDARFRRFKGVVHTAGGWRSINVAEGALSVLSAQPAESSRLELISDQMLIPAAVDQQLRLAVISWQQSTE